MGDKKNRILIVEDNDGLAQLLAAIFKRTGLCETVTVGDGVDALSAARAEPPTLILLDLRLPTLSGIEVCQRLRNMPQTSSIPILMYTAVGDRQTVLAGLQAGASDYVIKGAISNKELVERAMRLIKESRDAGEIQSCDPDHKTTTIIKKAFPDALKREKTDSLLQPQAHEPAGPPRLMTRASLARKISNVSELKALPFAVKELLALSSNPNVDVREVVTVIERDSAIAAQVLRLSNAAIYGAGQRISTLDRAVAIIGMKTIRELVMGLAVIEAFKDENGEFGRQQILLSEHSFGTAVIARLLAMRTTRAEPEKVFLGGLLHDVGKSMLFQFCGKEYDQVIRYAADTGLALEDVEKHMLGMSHCEVAALMLNKWMMPPEISLPPSLHHQPWETIKRRASAQSASIVCIMLGDMIAQACRFGFAGEERLAEPEHEMVDALGISDVSVDSLYTEACAHYRHLRTNMMLHSKPAMIKKLAEAQTEGTHRGVHVTIVDNKPTPLSPVEFFLVHCGARVKYIKTTEIRRQPSDEQDLLILRARTESVLRTMWEAVQESRCRPPECSVLALVNSDVNALFLPPDAGIRCLALPCRLDQFEAMIPQVGAVRVEGGRDSHTDL
jgi:putative nucleotidyltransferase with HDIG domain